MQTPKRNPQVLFNSRQHNSKCVCEICTCGQHRCPKPKIRFEGETTNHQHYKAHQITPQPQYKQVHTTHTRHYDPQLLKSSYDADYKQHRIAKELPQPQAQYKKTSAKFYDETQYSKAYVPNKIEVDRPNTAIKYVPNKAKFDGTTTYNQQYSPKKVQKDTDHYDSSNAYEKRRVVPFQGKSTYNEFYTPHKMQVIKVEEPKYQVPKTRFQGKSNYQEEYQRKRIEVPKGCPINELPRYPRECSPGKTHVNFSAGNNEWD